MSSEPVAEAELGAAKPRVLVLVHAAGDRRVLARWLSEDFDVAEATSDSSLQDDFDLCILDDAAFLAVWRAIADRKRRSEPVFLPFVRLSWERMAPMVAQVPTYDIDEVLQAPVNQSTLLARVGRLLERRGRERGLAEERDKAMQQLRAAQEASRRELATTRLLLRAADTLSESVDPDDVVGALSEIVTEATGRTRVAVSLYDAARDEAVITASGGGSPVPSGSRVPIGTLAPEARKAIDQRQPQVIDYERPDMPPPSRQRGASVGYRLVLMVPLVHGETVIGYMNVDDPGERRPFGDREIEVVQAIASQAAVALENARLFESLGRQAEYAEAVNRINDAIHSTLEQEEILDRVVIEVRDVLQGDSAGIQVFRDDRWQLEHVHGAMTAQPTLAEELPGPRTDGLLQLLTNRTPVVSADVEYDEREEVRRMARFGIRSLGAVPLVVREELLGVLFVAWSDSHHVLADEEVDFLQKAAAALALALENARLYEERSRQAQYAEALNRINSAVHSSLDFDEIMRRVVVEITEALAVDTTAVHMRLDDHWEFTHEHNLLQGLRGGRLSDDEARLSARVLRTREPVVANDVLHDDRANVRLMERAGIKALVGVPLVMRNVARGVLFASCSSGTARFTKDQVDFLGKAAATLALALENARLYETERNIADRLQEALLTLPDRLSGIEFAHAYHSATEAARVGGDFYDVFEIEHDSVGITIGDVAGKGLDAAVLTSLVKNTIRAHANEMGATPRQILRLTNDVVFKATSTESFVTVFFAVLDCRDGRLLYANGGHTSPAVVRSDGSTTRLLATGPLLGAFSGVDFDQEETRLEPDDLLFLYTDGLTEARRDGELFGEDRVFELLVRLGDRSPRATVEAVIDGVFDFAGGRLSDDLALLALKRSERGAETPSQQKLEM